jgi:elongation factor Ts
MAEINSAMIKDLREQTGAGMMDCKKALDETKGNIQEAVDWLRKKGLAAAAKKSGRVAAEGLVAVAVSGNKAAVIELNSETDFVARNDQFQMLAKNIAMLAVDHGKDVEALKNTKGAEGKIVTDMIANLVGTIGENMNLRRSAVLSVTKGAIASYVHSSIASGLGKIGVLVGVETDGDAAKAEALGKQIAMHIAAARPDALSVADVDPAKLDRERAVFKEQAIASGKAPEIAEKMVEGRIRKYYEEVVLMEQIYVMDNKSKISQVLKDAEKDIGAPVKISAFIRYNLGEGIEKQQGDFAAEVAAAAGANAA